MVNGTAGRVILAVDTIVSMATMQRAVLYEINVTPRSGAAVGPVTFELSVDMQGIVRLFNGTDDWQFGHSTTFRNQTGPDQFSVSALELDSDGRKQRRRGVIVADRRTSAAAALLLTRHMDELVLRPDGAGTGGLVGGRATVSVGTTSPGSPYRLGLVLAVSETAAAAREMAMAMAGTPAAFDAAAAAAADGWQARWRSAFTPGNGHYSGHLPIITTAAGPAAAAAAAVSDVYYRSAVSFLSIEKAVEDTHTTTTWTRAYTTGGPRTGVTADYFWDMPYQSTLLSLLDPAYVRTFALQALQSGIHSTYEINYMSGKGEGRSV